MDGPDVLHRDGSMRRARAHGPAGQHVRGPQIDSAREESVEVTGIVKAPALPDAPDATLRRLGEGEVEEAAVEPLFAKISLNAVVFSKELVEPAARADEHPAKLDRIKIPPMEMLGNVALDCGET